MIRGMTWLLVGLCLLASIHRCATPSAAQPPKGPAPQATDPVGQPESPAAQLDKTDPVADPVKPVSPPQRKDPPGLHRLSPDHDVWIDPKRKLVVVEGYVCLRQGALEMFACPQGTKEHESVVALNCKAWQVHAALIAVGGKPVHPVRFDPKYEPAKGTEIQIDVARGTPRIIL